MRGGEIDRADAMRRAEQLSANERHVLSRMPNDGSETVTFTLRDAQVWAPAKVLEALARKDLVWYYPQGRHPRVYELTEIGVQVANVISRNE